MEAGQEAFLHWVEMAATAALDHKMYAVGCSEKWKVRHHPTGGGGIATRAKKISRRLHRDP